MKHLPKFTGLLAICSIAAGHLHAVDDAVPAPEDVVLYRNVLESAPASGNVFFQQRAFVAPAPGEAGVTIRWQGGELAQADPQGPGAPGPQGPQGPRGPKGPPNGPMTQEFEIHAGGGGMFGDVDHFIQSMMPGRGMPHTVIVPSGVLDEAALSEVESNLVIMARILDRALERDAKSADTAMGINVTIGTRPGQNMFLEGFGVVFERSVGFPLTPTQKADRPEPRKPDNEWERARSEIFGNTREPGRGFGPQDGFNPGTPEYDADRVDRLKTQVLESLKNASNLRHLKPQDTVVVSVSGADNRSFFARTLRTTTSRGPRGAGGGGGGGSSGGGVGEANPQPPAGLVTAGGPGPDGPRNRPGPGGPGPGPRPSALTIRVKKADIDAFAADKLSLEEFKKKAFIQVN